VRVCNSSSVTVGAMSDVLTHVAPAAARSRSTVTSSASRLRRTFDLVRIGATTTVLSRHEKARRGRVPSLALSYYRRPAHAFIQPDFDPLLSHILFLASSARTQIHSEINVSNSRGRAETAQLASLCISFAICLPRRAGVSAHLARRRPAAVGRSGAAIAFSSRTISSLAILFPILIPPCATSRQGDHASAREREPGQEARSPTWIGAATHARPYCVLGPYVTYCSDIFCWAVPLIDEFPSGRATLAFLEIHRGPMCP